MIYSAGLTILQVSCLETYAVSICGSATNRTCTCGDSTYRAAVKLCVYTPCEIPDQLLVDRYAAESCGEAHDLSKIHEVLIMDYILPFLTTLFVVGRIYARIKLDVGLGADDWVLISAYIFYMITVATSLGLVLNHFGEHTYWLSTTQVITSLKVGFHSVVERAPCGSNLDI